MIESERKFWLYQPDSFSSSRYLIKFLEIIFINNFYWYNFINVSLINNQKFYDLE